MESLTITVESPEAGRAVVTVAGELDLSVADDLWDRLGPLLAPDAVAVLDGTGVTFLDSSGLRVLLRARNLAFANGAAFRLVAPQRSVQRVLELAGTLELLELRTSVAAALAG